MIWIVMRRLRQVGKTVSCMSKQTPKKSEDYALKIKSLLMIFDKHTNLKYRNRHFWGRRYYIDTVGRNKESIT